MKTKWFICSMACASLAALPLLGLSPSGGIAPAPAQQEALLAATPLSAQRFPTWELNGSRRETNAALEKAYGWERGGAARALSGILQEELAKPGGGDSNTVTRALEAIRTSGDASAIGALDSLLFSKRVPFRPELFCTRAECCGFGHWEFAKRFVKALPARERRACYAAALPLADDKSSTNAPRWRVFVTLCSCAAEETDASLAELLDRGLASNTIWQNRNLRRRVAARFAGIFSKPGRYFRQLAEEIGPPVRHPDRDAIRRGLLQVWDDAETPEGQALLEQKWQTILFAQDYAMAERDVVRLLEREFMKMLGEKSDSDEAKFFYGYALAGIYRYRDPESTNMLAAAVRADWHPRRERALGTYIKLAGMASLPFAREMLSNKRLFSLGGRHMSYNRISELAQGDGMPEETIRTVSEVLKAFMLSDEDNIDSLDSAILRIDPGWERSEERKRLVARQIAILTAKLTPPISLDEAFAEIDPGWKNSEERKKMVESSLTHVLNAERRQTRLDSAITAYGPDFWAPSKEKQEMVMRELRRLGTESMLRYFKAVQEKIGKPEADGEEK